MFAKNLGNVLGSSALVSFEKPMKSPLKNSALQVLSVTDSTQIQAAAAVRTGDQTVGGVRAEHQKAGKGRQDRVWVSGEGDSLTVSLIFWDYADHSKPWLIGMSVAIAAAGALHCKLKWPNDLILEGKKLGGILGELVTDPQGRRIPVIGIGINLNQAEFSGDLQETAISLAQHRRGTAKDAGEVLERVLSRLELVAEPDSWNDLRTSWMVFDATPGKKYRLADGAEAIGLGIGPEGELICSVDGETQSVMAAETIVSA